MVEKYFPLDNMEYPDVWEGLLIWNTLDLLQLAFNQKNTSCLPSLIYENNSTGM